MRRFGGTQTSNCFTWFQGIGKLAVIVLFIIPACWAQIPQAGDTTSTPVPGAGHDYVHAPLETVNPANGSVSIRIPVRMPSGRELTLPLSFAYDSNGAFYLGNPPGIPAGLQWDTTNTALGLGGWSYGAPMMSVQSTSWIAAGGENGTTCTATVSYVFQDAAGNRHNMALSVFNPIGRGGGNCAASGDGGHDGEVTTGGEGPIVATTTIPGSKGNQLIQPVAVSDGNGTTYSFPISNYQPPLTWLPGSVVDRNGNFVQLNGAPLSSAFSYTDTAGRPALSVSGLGGNPDTVTVDGLASPYKVYWTPVSAHFTVNMTTLPFSSDACGQPSSNTSSSVSSIVLPNGQQFTFTYDPTYGMLSKITYPTGGYVRYVWGLNPQSEAAILSDSTQSHPTGQYWCVYDSPAITDRYVSFDGGHEDLHQQFSYSTNFGLQSSTWTTKRTTVTTTDLDRNTSFQTVYTYSPLDSPYVPNSGTSITTQIPVEQSIAYYGTNGALLKTVAKTWCNVRELCSEQTTLDNNFVAKTTYAYNTNEQETERDDYDFGSGGPGPLLRKTVTNYASFSGTHIVDLPSSVIVYDSSGTNRVAETDSYYDQNGLQPTSVVGHEALPTGTGRGNLTTLTKQCIQAAPACSSGNSTTSYTYFDTGQPYAMTDPRGNTTQYSYADSYSGCGGNAPPSGATNAYLTQITYPPTNGVNHIESRCYDYSAGLLRSSTDENNQVTGYAYADSLDRLTETDYPDTGQTLVSYNDAPPSPSITVSKKLNTSGQYVTSTSVMNGIGLVKETALTSDPAGADLTFITFDGLGRTYTVTNPYRSTTDPTYGVTTYAYDALGRTTQVANPDGSTIGTIYTGRATEVTDEGNGSKSVQRISQIDALGRLTSVCEVSGATQLGTTPSPAGCGQDIGATGFLTGYNYDALGNLTGVTQGGLNPRTFAYNSLSQLTSATNPESGQTSYMYDANGNVFTKTDARGIATTYAYDALNRLLSKTYSDGTTPSANFTYDASSEWGVALTNPIGRLVLQNSDNGHAMAIFSYDPMGRIANEYQCTPVNCGSGAFPLAYTYNFLGDELTSTNGVGVAFTSTYNAAAQMTQMTSSWSDANHPGTLLSSVQYNPLGALTNDTLGNGVGETLTYAPRGWLTSVSALSSAVPATAGTGNVAIDGTEQSAQVYICQAPIKPGAVSPQISCYRTVYDKGTVSITVNGFVATTSYGSTSTDASIATNLANLLNGTSSPVTATSSGGTVYLTSKATGAASNYSLSATSVTNNPADFGGPSFSPLASGATLTGGKDASGGTAYALTIPAAGGRAPNGDILQANDSANGNWVYSYDDFNRLIGANQNSGQAVYNYAYDRFGNRWQQNGPQTMLLTFSGANNRMDGYSYDASGNLLNDGSHSYAYDAESRIVSVDGGAITYAYDANGQRARKTVSGVSVDYVYDLAGHQIAEINSSGGANREEVYAGGRHLATYVSNTTYFNLSDWIGTERVRTNTAGTVCESISSLPFGDGESTVGSCGDPSPMHFTGKQRDTETNLDDFDARYYSSQLGRFISADWSAVPVAVPYANLTNPQTLNLYAIVHDNPETFADLDGHCSAFPGAGGQPCSSNGPNPPQKGQPAGNDTTKSSQKKQKPTLLDRAWSWVTHHKAEIGVQTAIAVATFGEAAPEEIGADALEIVSEEGAAEETAAEGEAAEAGETKWKFGANKSAQKWQSQMEQRGWTTEQIDDAVANGEKFPATNNVNPGNSATRYVNPSTGRSVVIDDVTHEVIHVGGDSFKY